MKEPPFLISPKDLLYLEDLLSHILVFAKKCNYYQTLVNNKDVCTQIKQVEDLLFNQYDELLLIMEGQ